MNGITIAHFHGDYEDWTITKVTEGYFAGRYLLRDAEQIVHVNASDLDFVLTWIQ